MGNLIVVTGGQVRIGGSGAPTEVSSVRTTQRLIRCTRGGREEDGAAVAMTETFIFDFFFVI